MTRKIREARDTHIKLLAWTYDEYGQEPSQEDIDTIDAFDELLIHDTQGNKRQWNRQMRRYLDGL